jgi:drug/metabolite transporter (DMT)-like permease
MPILISLGAITVMLLWSLCFPLITVGLDSSPPFFFAAIRALIAGLILLLCAIALRRPLPRKRSVWIGTVVVGLSATSLGFFGMFFGGGLISPGIATVIANTQPLMAAILAYFWLKESFTTQQKVGLMIGFVGIILISISSNNTNTPTSTLGIIYILAGAVGVAFGNVTLKWLAGKGDVWMLMGLQLVIGSIPLFVLSNIYESTQQVIWDTSFVLSLATLSIFGTAAAAALWFSLLEHIELSRINVFTFLTPIFGLIIGFSFFNEVLGRLHVIGIALSILSICLVSYQSKNRQSTHDKRS